MNTYEKPEIEVIEFEISNVISSSDFEHDNAYGDINDLLRGK